MTVLSFDATLTTYLESKGIGAVEAGQIRTLVNRLLTIYAPDNSHTKVLYPNEVFKDASLIQMLNNVSRMIYDVAVGTFIGYSANGSLLATHPTNAECVTWISVNRPDIPANLAASAGIPAIVYSDLNAVLIPNAANTPVLPTGDPQVPDNPLDIYKGLVSATLEQIIRYMRTAPGMGATTDVSTNSSSYGSTSVPVLPDVTL